MEQIEVPESPNQHSEEVGHRSVSRPSGGMADTRDLKSRDSKGSCGFESRLGHSVSLVFTSTYAKHLTMFVGRFLLMRIGCTAVAWLFRAFLCNLHATKNRLNVVALPFFGRVNTNAWMKDDELIVDVRSHLAINERKLIVALRLADTGIGSLFRFDRTTLRAHSGGIFCLAGSSNGASIVRVRRLFCNSIGSMRCTAKDVRCRAG